MPGVYDVTSNLIEHADQRWQSLSCICHPPKDPQLAFENKVVLTVTLPPSALRSGKAVDGLVWHQTIGVLQKFYTKTGFCTRRSLILEEMWSLSADPIQEIIDVQIAPGGYAGRCNVEDPLLPKACKLVSHVVLVGYVGQAYHNTPDNTGPVTKADEEKAAAGDHDSKALETQKGRAAITRSAAVVAPGINLLVSMLYANRDAAKYKVTLLDDRATVASYDATEPHCHSTDVPDAREPVDPPPPPEGGGPKTPGGGPAPSGPPPSGPTTPGQGGPNTPGPKQGGPSTGTGPWTPGRGTGLFGPGGPFDGAPGSSREPWAT